MTVRDLSFAFEGGSHRAVQLFRQFDDVIHMETRTVAYDDHRSLGFPDHTDRFIHALSRELIDRFPQMLNVDLRYPNGFAIQWQDALEDGQYLSAIEQGPDTKTATGN